MKLLNRRVFLVFTLDRFPLPKAEGIFQNNRSLRAFATALARVFTCSLA
jgi:hypothetical protein